MNTLGDRIRAGRLKPGVKLPTEAALMDQFGVSRTVVREGLSRLQQAGLVKLKGGGSTISTPADVEPQGSRVKVVPISAQQTVTSLPPGQLAMGSSTTWLLPFSVLCVAYDHRP